MGRGKGTSGAGRNFSDEVVDQKLADARARKHSDGLRISAAMEGMAMEVKGRETC